MLRPSSACRRNWTVGAHSPSAQRRREAVVVATIAVLLAGFVIGAGCSSPSAAAVGSSAAACRSVPPTRFATTSTTVRSSRRAGPTAASGCTLDEGDIVAYKVEQPDGCTLNVSREKFVCGDQPADLSTLAQYPVSIETIDDVDTVLVDLTDRPASTTAPPTSTSTSIAAADRHTLHTIGEAHVGSRADVEEDGVKRGTIWGALPDGNRARPAYGRAGRHSRRRHCPTEAFMPRYLVQRSFPRRLGISHRRDGAARRSTRSPRATPTAKFAWVHSYVSDDDRTTWCIYDAPTPEAIAAATAGANGLPVEQISQVTVLDPYFSTAPTAECPTAHQRTTAGGAGGNGRQT